MDEPIGSEATARKRDEKLRIPVRGTNRKYYLVAPQPQYNRPDYYVRFEVPRKLREQDAKLPKYILRSTGTDLVKVALIKGRDIIESILGGQWETAEKGKMKQARAAATIDELLERYDPPARDVSAETATRNKSAVRLYARELTGRPDPDTVQVSAVFTAKQRRAFISLRLAPVAKRSLMEQESAAHTINTTMAMVQSVVSPDVMDGYADLNLNLGELAEFRAVPRLRTDKRHVAYRRLPQECVDAMEAEARALKRGESPIAKTMGLSKEQHQAVYRAYLLMSRLGLRNIEAFHARWSWIERQPDGRGLFVIERRADFVPKNKSDRTIELTAAELAILDEFRGLPDAWIVAQTYKERDEACYNHINAWLAPLLPAKQVKRGKGAYLLRKEAGSRIADRPASEGGGIQAAADFLGDSVATTEKFYRGRRRTVRGVSSGELAVAA